MATWEDGPEYAPLEPPAQFTVPDVPPLSEAPPPEEVPPVPGDRPQFGDPQKPVAPLATLVPEEEGEERDPRTPFAVDSDAMTQGGAGGAWGAAHWRPPAGRQSTPSGQRGEWRPPSGAPVSPTDPVALQSGPPQSVGNLPAPGTPAWFGPGPVPPAAETRPASPWKAVPPAVLILLICSLLYVIAPFSYCLAFILAARLRYARRRVLIAFGIAFGGALTISTVSALANYATLGEWYMSLSVWLVLASLLMLVVIYVMVKNELDRLPRRPPDGNYSYPPPPGR